MNITAKEKETCDEKRETLNLAEKKSARVEDYTDELRDAVRNCEDDEKLMFDAPAVFIASVMEG